MIPDNALICLIDIENLFWTERNTNNHDAPSAEEILKAIKRMIEKLGTPLIVEVFVDIQHFTRQLKGVRQEGFDRTASALNISIQHCSGLGGGQTNGVARKDLVDWHLIQRGNLYAHLIPNNWRLVLASGDRDFLPFIGTMKALGHRPTLIVPEGRERTILAREASEVLVLDYHGVISRTQVPRQLPETGPEQNRVSAVTKWYELIGAAIDDEIRPNEKINSEMIEIAATVIRRLTRSFQAHKNRPCGYFRCLQHATGTGAWSNEFHFLIAALTDTGVLTRVKLQNERHVYRLDFDHPLVSWVESEEAEEYLPEADENGA